MTPDFIVPSVTGKKVLYYWSQVGFSTVDKKVVEADDKIKNLQNLFVEANNRKIHVLTAAVDKAFVSDWKPVLVSSNFDLQVICWIL